MSWYLLVLGGISCVLSSELRCPNCPNNCVEGFLFCDSCQCLPTCNDFSCSPPYVCVIEAAVCSSFPCPGIPSCVDLTRSCGQLAPLFDVSSPIICNVNGVQCPIDYTCTLVPHHSFSVCCRTTKDSGPYAPGIGELPFVHPSLLPSPNQSPDGAAEELDCECSINVDMMCEMTTCSLRPDALCKSDPCTCTAMYVDADGDPVQCEEETNRFDIPPLFLDSLGISSVSITPSPNLGHTQQEHTQSSQYPFAGLGSRRKNNSSNFPTAALVGGLVGLFVVVAVVAGTMVHRAKKQSKTSDEEQSKPLNANKKREPNKV